MRSTFPALLACVLVGCEPAAGPQSPPTAAPTPERQAEPNTRPTARRAGRPPRPQHDLRALDQTAEAELLAAFLHSAPAARDRYAKTRWRFQARVGQVLARGVLHVGVMVAPGQGRLVSVHTRGSGGDHLGRGDVVTFEATVQDYSNNSPPGIFFDDAVVVDGN